MEDDTAELMMLADRFYKLTSDLVVEGHKPFAIAAVHVMIALQIYKTSLSREDYNQMVDSISDNRDKIRALSDVVQDLSLRSFH
jgi:hypothetical protein